MLQMSQRALTASAADGELFVNRTEELAALERAIRLGFNVYVSGPVGSGKTSLLRRLQARLDRVVFVNLSHVVTFTDLVADLARAIQPAAPGSGPGPGADTGPDSDRLAPLRVAALEQPGGAASVVVVDGLSPELRHELFGRQRDGLWELPLRWIVAGDIPTPGLPADTFFETSVTLGALDPDAIRQLLLRRARTGTPDERRRLKELAATLPEVVVAATPRQVLSLARSVMLTEDPDLVLDAMRDLQSESGARAHLSPTAGRVLDALYALGPTYAGDQRLLDEIGTTRSRIAQVFKQLEDAGLVRSRQIGRRKLYGPGVYFVAGSGTGESDFYLQFHPKAAQ